MLPALGKKAVLEWCMCLCERFDWILVCMSEMGKKYGIERKNGHPALREKASRSISPLIDGTTRMMIDEPKDLNLPSSNENSRPATPQDTTCRKRVLLTARLRTMKSGIDDVRNIINNYKVNGHDT
ncbi:hypothetical protein TNCV_1299271 [Trichonephila clavipes]|nr:hypothetical protein TNCV_1299271 [Trichonephila clavipes]